MQSTRRELLRKIGLGIVCAGLASSPLARAEIRAHKEGEVGRTVEDWMNAWMTTKAPVGTLHLSRFADPIYFLLKPITWRPNPGQESFGSVTVPTGFVTDFASIPQPFWSLLRPDGDYTYPAIVHDFLYWTQTRPRAAADKIFEFGMEDFGVNTSTVAVIYNAVRAGGGIAWKNNAELRRNGERRILKRFPDDPRVRWEAWKSVPGVFGDQ
jgi:hypothetical protein